MTLKEILQTSGISQQWLARKMNLSKGAIHFILKNPNHARRGEIKQYLWENATQMLNNLKDFT